MLLSYLDRLGLALAGLVDGLCDPKRWRRTTLLLVLAFAAAWMLYGVIAKSSQDLNADMAEMVIWAREPALGYPKHPPLLAYVVRLWFSVFPLADWAFTVACGDDRLRRHLFGHRALRSLAGRRKARGGAVSACRGALLYFLRFEIRSELRADPALGVDAVGLHALARDAARRLGGADGACRGRRDDDQILVGISARGLGSHDTA